MRKNSICNKNVQTEILQQKHICKMPSRVCKLAMEVCRCTSPLLQMCTQSLHMLFPNHACCLQHCTIWISNDASNICKSCKTKHSNLQTKFANLQDNFFLWNRKPSLRTCKPSFFWRKVKNKCACVARERCKRCKTMLQNSQAISYSLQGLLVDVYTTMCKRCTEFATRWENVWQMFKPFVFVANFPNKIAELQAKFAIWQTQTLLPMCRQSVRSCEQCM